MEGGAEAVMTSTMRSTGFRRSSMTRCAMSKKAPMDCPGMLFVTEATDGERSIIFIRRTGKHWQNGLKAIALGLFHG